MSDEHCGDCEYHLIVEQGLFECQLDSERHKSGYKCEHHKSPTRMSPQEKLFAVASKKKEIEADKERKHAEEMADKDREHKDKLARKDRLLKIVIAIGSIILTALITKLLSLW